MADEKAEGLFHHDEDRELTLNLNITVGEIVLRVVYDVTAEDKAILDGLLSDSKKIANRLAKLDAQN